MAMRIRKGDEILVIVGKDRGKKGIVQTVLTDKQKVVVVGINMVKKHQKPGAGKAGGIIEKESPIAISNVMLVDSKTGKPSRINFTTVGGSKIRRFLVSGELLSGKEAK